MVGQKYRGDSGTCTDSDVQRFGKGKEGTEREIMSILKMEVSYKAIMQSLTLQEIEAILLNKNYGRFVLYK